MSLILVECGHNSQKLGSSLFLEMNWSQSLKNAMPPSNNNTSVLLGVGVCSVSCCSTRSRRLRWLWLWCLLPDLLTSALWIHCSFWVSCSDVPRLPLCKNAGAFTCFYSLFLTLLPIQSFTWHFESCTFPLAWWCLELLFPIWPVIGCCGVSCCSVVSSLWACTGVPCVDLRGAAFTNTSNCVCI